MGGEAQKVRFRLDSDPPEPQRLEPQRPEPPGVGVWGLVLHMLLMIPLVPTAFINAIVTVSGVGAFVRALRAPTHRVIVSGAATPTSALLLALFLVVMVAGLALLAWVFILLARTVLGHRVWRVVLLWSIGLLALGAGVWGFTAAGVAATASVFGVYGYVAAIAVGHLLWPRHRVAQ